MRLPGARLSVSKDCAFESTHNFRDDWFDRGFEDFFLGAESRKYIVERVAWFELLAALALDDGYGSFLRFTRDDGQGAMFLFCVVDGAQADDYLDGGAFAA